VDRFRQFVALGGCSSGISARQAIGLVDSHRYWPEAFPDVLFVTPE